MSDRGVDVILDFIGGDYAEKNIKLLAEDAPFFHLELTYDGDVLVKAVLDGVSML